MPCLPDIVDWIKAGLPDREIARRVHGEGQCEDVTVHALAQEVRTYRLKVMRPGDVAERQLAAGMVDSMGAAKRGLEELDELDALYRGQDEDITMARACLQQNFEVISLIGQTLMEATIAEVDPEKPEPAKGKKKPSFTVHLKALLKANSQMVKDIKELAKVRDAARKSLMTSAQVRSLLGLENTGQLDSETDIEARVETYTMKRFAGRADVQKVMLDPEKRARVMSLFQRMTTDPHLLRDLKDRYEDNSPDADDPDILDVEPDPSDEGPN